MRAFQGVEMLRNAWGGRWLLRTLIAVVFVVGALPAQARNAAAEKKAWEYNQLAALYANRGKTREAIRLYTEAIRLNPRAAVYYNNRAAALAKAGERERALVDYGEAIKRERTAAVFYNNRGVLLSDMGQPARAIADFDQAIRRDPKAALFRYHRAQAFDALAKTAKAVADLRAAVRLDKNFTAARQMLLVLKEDLRKPKTAVPVMKGEVVAPLPALQSPPNAKNVKERRFALVIGVNRYPKLGAPFALKRAVNDAVTLSDHVRRLGFSVSLVRNAGLADMKANVAAIAKQLKLGDTVFFFFSGHGMSPEGSNLLLPSDMPKLTGGLTGEAAAREHAYAEADIIAAFRKRLTDPANGRQRGLIIFVSDACRDNPFGHNLTKSLRAMPIGVAPKPASGVFSIYSAGSGQTALDRLSDSDKSKNSVFMRVFVKHLMQPGLQLSDVVEDVKGEVARLAATVKDPETGLPHVQTPAYYNETQGGRIILSVLPR
jgi:tetratricopeptide (TPR) repeat protein